MTDFAALFGALAAADVEFILVGGVAATTHGSVRLTLDVDVVYRRSPENHGKLVSALRSHEPYLRGAPPGLPFSWNTATIDSGLNFTLTTAIGDINLLGEIVGGGGYEELLPHTIEVEVFGHRCHCLNLEFLIHVKRAAGRPKDLEVVAELEALREEWARADGTETR